MLNFSLTMTSFYEHLPGHDISGSADLVCRKHGTFRPKLLALVSDNSDSNIEAVTREAFSTYRKGPEYLGEAIKQLVGLKGIGPATASLLLSVYDPARIPFFSDELFRYLHWFAGMSVNTWLIPIKYNAKEYASLNEKAQVLLERLDRKFGAVQLEQTAYVLGKERADLSSPEQAKETNKPTSTNKNLKKDLSATNADKKTSEKKSEEAVPVKRKASDVETRKDDKLTDEHKDCPKIRRSKRLKSG